MNGFESSRAKRGIFLNGTRTRLSVTGIYKVIRKLGEQVGVNVRPHGLRHAAITEALTLTGGDVRAVQRFSRHKQLQTVTVYDDNRADLAGEVARCVAASIAV